MADPINPANPLGLPVLRVVAVDCPKCENAFMVDIAAAMLVEFCPFCGQRKPPMNLNGTPVKEIVQ